MSQWRVECVRVQEGDTMRYDMISYDKVAVRFGLGFLSHGPFPIKRRGVK